MERPRVYEIANEAGVDARTALRALASLGSDITEPTRRLDPDLASRLRSALSLPSTIPETLTESTSKPKVHRALARPAAARAERIPSRQKQIIQQLPKEGLGQEHKAAVREMIPSLYNLLLRCGRGSAANGVIVIYHDARLQPEYGLSTVCHEHWMPEAGSGVSRDALLGPLRALDRRYRDRALMPPNAFIFIDVPNRRVWFDRHFNPRTNGPYLDAITLEPIREVLEGPPARLATRAQIFSPEHVPALVRDLSRPKDRPEEAFLLHEELLQLAVDTLESDEQLDPLPVHINGLWVFARPVIMHRPNGSERHVRAVWYRQGDVLWRMRTFAAGVGNVPKEVGEQLVGRLPFDPVWDATRPEQKLLAAVWALMAQGGVTETERRAPDGGPPVYSPERGDLTIVRVKAGTDHARVYRGDDPSNSIGRPAWGVRGHWRHQPYPSLGRDAAGNTITKMKWIATYTKGDVQGSKLKEKVIVVRP